VKTIVIITRVQPGYHKVNLLRAIRSVDEIALAPAQAMLADVMHGSPVTFELPSRAAAERFLAEIRGAGADGRIED
jgi:hypothetical protein